MVRPIVNINVDRRDLTVRLIVGIVLLVLAAILSTGCIAHPLPTAPTAIEPTPAPSTAIAQLMIRIAGPDSWWNDRLYVHVTGFTADGVGARGVVQCESTRGTFEPSAWPIESRGSEVRGVVPGAVLICRHGKVEATYTISANDWRIITGPGNGPPRPVAPPVTPPTAPPVTPPATPPTPPGGGGE